MAETQLKGPGIVDRIAIDDLFTEYLWALDTGDTEGWLNAFADDAEVWETQKDGTIWKGRGRDDLRQLIGKYHGNPDFPGHQHREGTRYLYLLAGALEHDEGAGALPTAAAYRYLRVSAD